MTTRRAVGALLVLILMGSIAACSPTSVTTPGRVSVPQGDITGTVDSGVVRYRGIPYAAAPVGDRRFAPPQEPPGWAGVRDATGPGPRCPQTAAPVGSEASANEDCLTLDVTTPADGASGLPVLVWIHGGGFANGGGRDYDPAGLVQRGRMVVVTINYRLGALGFLATPGMDGGGSFGLLDQQAALRWVRSGIGAFGGDARNVTVAGQSAGGDAVCALLTSPGAVGLFDKAVMQTGSCSPINVTDAIIPGAGPSVDTWKPIGSVEQAGAAFAVAAGCPDTSIGCLRKLPVGAFTRPGATYWSPAVGTPTLPEHPSVALAAGRSAGIPVMSGTARDEGAYFTGVLLAAVPWNEGTFDGLLGIAAGPAAAEVRAVYRGQQRSAGHDARTPRRSWADVVTDRAYACPTLQTTNAMAGHGPVYAYEFAQAGAPSPYGAVPPDLAGMATHGSETAYLFTLANTPPLPLGDATLADRMKDYIARFAATGDPNGKGLPPWPEYGTEQAVLSLGRAIAPLSANAFAEEHHCGLWNR